MGKGQQKAREAEKKAKAPVPFNVFPLSFLDLAGYILHQIRFQTISPHSTHHHTNLRERRQYRGNTSNIYLFNPLLG